MNSRSALGQLRCALLTSIHHCSVVLEVCADNRHAGILDEHSTTYPQLVVVRHVVWLHNTRCVVKKITLLYAEV